MAISKTTNYGGEFLEEMVRKVTTGNETVQQGLVYIKEGIKGKYNIPRVKSDSFVQSYQSTPTGATGTFTLSEVQLDPDKFMVYTTFKPEDLEDYWLEYQPTGEFVFQELPESVQTAMMGEVIDSVDTYMGSALWNGSLSATGSTNLKYFDGLIVKALEDNDVIDIASPSALTVSNIEAELDRVYKATPKAVRQSPNFKIIMSLGSYDLYEEAQYAKSNKGANVTDAGLARFRGKTIIPLVGFPDDTIIATMASADRSSNLWVGLSSIGDNVTVNVDRVANNSEDYFMKMIMKIDTAIKFGDELVLYKA